MHLVFVTVKAILIELPVKQVDFYYNGLKYRKINIEDKEDIMSKFIDSLNRSHHSTTQTIGFRKESDLSKRPPMLLIVDMTGRSVKDVKAIVGAGIDAVIMRSNGLNATDVEKVMKNIGEVPAGLLIEDENWEKYREIFSSRFDFVICNVKTPVSLMTEGVSGKILRVAPWLAPGVLRAINELSVTFDGIFVDSDDTPITIERLLVCHYIAGMLGKPLLSSVNIPLTQLDLWGLYEASVRGLLLPQEISVETLVELKDLIGSIPMNVRKRPLGSVLLPSLKQESEVENEEEEEY